MKPRQKVHTYIININIKTEYFDIANAIKKEDEKESDEFISQVAEAPKVLPTMQSIKELDRAVKFTIPSVTVCSSNNYYYQFIHFIVVFVWLLIIDYM